ncbi:MAG: acetyl-CoA carboxylase, carboxyltransferase subunit beta [Oscillospiraceae bacterium]|jgi:acetyl-CoA carboxylase carboxyl transferase subunit beta|nr:acetyl-CoA carboxylase, carboxyltransferase subunit beta [Oscillospiraceae bacterium]
MGNVFSDRKNKLNILKALRRPEAAGAPPAEKYITCPVCKNDTTQLALKKAYYVCKECGHHFKISYKTYMTMIFDADSIKRLFTGIGPKNPIDFPDYDKKLSAQRSKTSMRDACECAVGKIGGVAAVCAVLDSSFMMGSMGTAVGEKVTRAVEYAARYELPLIIFSASGGARMQEGIFSLMQMAKTSAALKRFSDEGGLFISYLTNPTTGGVTASFASLGDVILAEPGALIGFAGPRVIEQTIKEALPEGFQRSEFLLEHGFVDSIVKRGDMREVLINILNLHRKKK